MEMAMVKLEAQEELCYALERIEIELSYAIRQLQDFQDLDRALDALERAKSDCEIRTAAIAESAGHSDQVDDTTSKYPASQLSPACSAELPKNIKDLEEIIRFLDENVIDMKVMGSGRDLPSYHQDMVKTLKVTYSILSEVNRL
jgi:hypothetical protein